MHQPPAGPPDGAQFRSRPGLHAGAERNSAFEMVLGRREEGRRLLTAYEVPEKIREMVRLGADGGLYAQREKLFYVQGKFMEDYEDDAPWNGRLVRYFPTYADLRLEQLRGYFTWRARLRRGGFSPICASLAYIYVYELLNGIGTDSPEDSLRKMKEFEAGFLDPGMGDPSMRANLRRWMFEFAVISGLPPETARNLADGEATRRAAALAVLRSPEEHGDEEVFGALCELGEHKIRGSSVMKKRPDEGMHLFAEAWRQADRNFGMERGDMFHACFGGGRQRLWEPLGNAVYWREKPHADADYVLNGCRSYSCRGGRWTELSWSDWMRKRHLFSGLLRETDRQLRLHLKTGHLLKPRPEDERFAALAEAVIEADRQAKIEAAMPKVTIRFDRLDEIRRAALEIRDSLLAGEEAEERAEDGAGGGRPADGGAPARPDARAGICGPEGVEPSDAAADRTPADGPPEQGTVPDDHLAEGTGAADPPEGGVQGTCGNGSSRTGSGKLSAVVSGASGNGPGEHAGPRGGFPPHASDVGGAGVAPDGGEDRDPFASSESARLHVLRMLVRGASVRDALRSRGIMPEVFADSLNEALFDELGDSAVLCAGGDLTLVDDYREDVMRILEGSAR